jgi:hypothetical protein
VKTYLRVKLFQLQEQAHVVFRYYRNIRFALVDLAFCLSGFFCNPYRICRKFTGAHSYGETPIRTFAAIADAADITKQDHFLDLGAGRGKLCFWAAFWLGCTCTGVEQVPFFVRQARGLAALFRAPVRFHLGSMETADISKATVVYLYVMEWDEALLEQMAPNARLISVGAPVESSSFAVVRKVPARYPWGITDVYVQRRI